VTQLDSFTHEHLEVRFPAPEPGMEQDEEWCEIDEGGETRQIRFHDYAEIYRVPGLYERLFYEGLRCRSPAAVCGLLWEQLGRDSARPSLSVLEVGAGNGMVAEELDRRGAESIVGIDIIEEAAEAAERDRPGLYDDYHVIDLTDIPPDVREELRRQRFKCLVTVAALGFGDIPPEAFAAAYNLIAVDGWVAFNIKEDFLADGEQSGFARLIRRMLDDGTLESCAQRRYRHRLSIAGEPLHYVAMVARKRGEAPL